MLRGGCLMSEVIKNDNPDVKKSNRSVDDSIGPKLDELVTILKSIDEKLVTISRAILEINARG
jgi:hypothetical protein